MIALSIAALLLGAMGGAVLATWRLARLGAVNAGDGYEQLLLKAAMEQDALYLRNQPGC